MVDEKHPSTELKEAMSLGWFLGGCSWYKRWKKWL